MSAAIYASDPDPAPDSDFVPGELRDLVTGNRGRLLDARRTPITVTAVKPAIGAFELELGAFEDAGARWELALEEIWRFQFARGGAVAPPDAVAELESALRRFDRELVIDPDPAAREATLRRIDRARADMRLGSPVPVDVAARVLARSGDPELFALLDGLLADRDVADLEQRFASAFVSNPRSGEFVKGHAIVLAELGLCRYRGKVVRDPNTFEGPDRKERRAEHLVARLAFTRELWSGIGEETVTLYRGAAVDGPLPEPSSSSFVSATFSREVSAAHFEGGATTRTAVQWRQSVPVTRLLMTFLETREMNGRFREAEAVLIGDPANRAF
ncbi:MAG: hypothetical protein ACLQA5_17025 [Solirubrobacteraceae bacterium]